ncbi:MAG: hypothetical protein JZU50_01665 [Desulfobulbaceae bacterium]|jgi:hypothetical protein|nr:hypothetical protein [Desulfobulbaceae bacterium]
MAILVGIHQEQEKINNIHESLGIRAGSLCSVGPFLSRKAALAWQQNMQQKFTECAVISFGEEETAAIPWYGFAFEK